MSETCWSGDLDELESAILELLDRRRPGATICPSEAARAVAAARSGGREAAAVRHAEGPATGSAADLEADDATDVTEAAGPDDGWRDLMELARAAARRLAEEGRVIITQGGEVVDPGAAVGPIRIGRAQPA